MARQIHKNELNIVQVDKLDLSVVPVLFGDRKLNKVDLYFTFVNHS